MSQNSDNKKHPREDVELFTDIVDEIPDDNKDDLTLSDTESESLEIDETDEVENKNNNVEDAIDTLPVDNDAKNGIADKINESDKKEINEKKSDEKQTNDAVIVAKKSFFIKFIALLVLLSVGFGMIGAYIINYFWDAGVVAKHSDVIINQVDNDDKVLIDKLDPNTIPKVVLNTHESVVAITTGTLTSNPVLGQYVTEGAGSGVIVSEDGYIVTNTHVIQDASSIIVRLSNNKEYPATVIGSDKTSDITVIKINAKGLKPATLGDSDVLVVGQSVIAIGNPLGELGGTVTSGIVSAKDREITINGQSMNLLQFSAAVNPGNSGGGLFNLNGEVVGIVNAKPSGSGVEGLGFAIPSNDVKNITKQLIETGKVSGRPQLGITVIEIKNMSDTYALVEDKIYPYLDSTGLYIDSSNDNKLYLGDKIIAIDGTSITSAEELQTYVEKKSVGDKVNITISREKKILNVEITLSEKN